MWTIYQDSPEYGCDDNPTYRWYGYFTVNGHITRSAGPFPTREAARRATTYQPDLLVIERKRFSTTQGEVLLTYDGTRIDQFGDTIQLQRTRPAGGEGWSEYSWVGMDDAYWHAVAQRLLGLPSA